MMASSARLCYTIDMKNIYDIQEQGLQWVNVTKQTEKELQTIQKRFDFSKQDIQECLPPFQRAKITKRDSYYFLVLHFPVFDRESRRLGFTEVDFFLTANIMVTVHDNKLVALENFFAECAKNDAKRKLYFNGTMVHTLFELLSRLFESVFPILLHINEDIGAVERKLFTNTPGKQVAAEILRLKTNIVTFRRAMQSHKTVLERLVMYADRDMDLVSYQNYINSLRESIGEIWHMLESQKESINALHETNESILSLHTNEVMKTLTIISVITFPLTLIATIFAIHAPGTPFLELPYGFWVLSVVILAGAIAMVAVFKKKRWL